MGDTRCVLEDIEGPATRFAVTYEKESLKFVPKRQLSEPTQIMQSNDHNEQKRLVSIFVCCDGFLQLFATIYALNRTNVTILVKLNTKVANKICNVLYCTVLYCIALYYIVLYYVLSHTLKNTANQRPGLPFAYSAVCNG